MLANSKNTTTLPEFSGSSASFRDWKLSFISQCSMISRAYECELSNSPLTPADLMTFLPPAMFDPEFADENPDTSASANIMLNEMIDRIRTDVSKKLYHLLVSITKGDARALVLQSSIEPEQKTCEHIMHVLTNRYHKRDINERCYLQRQLLAVKAEHGSNISKVVDQLLSRVAKLRYELSLLGELYEDSTIVSLVINALQNSKILPTTTEMVLQQGNYNCEHVFSMLRDSAVRKHREGHSSHKTGVVLSTSSNTVNHRENGNGKKKGAPARRAEAVALYVQPNRGKGGNFPSRTSSQGKGKSGGKGKGKSKGSSKGTQGPCWGCGGPHRLANCPRKHSRSNNNHYVFQVSRSDRPAVLCLGQSMQQAVHQAPPLMLPQAVQPVFNPLATPPTPTVPAPPMQTDQGYLQRSSSTQSVTMHDSQPDYIIDPHQLEMQLQTMAMYHQPEHPFPADIYQHMPVPQVGHYPTMYHQPGPYTQPPAPQVATMLQQPQVPQPPALKLPPLLVYYLWLVVL